MVVEDENEINTTDDEFWMQLRNNSSKYPKAAIRGTPISTFDEISINQDFVVKRQRLKAIKCRKKNESILVRMLSIQVKGVSGEGHTSFTFPVFR